MEILFYYLISFDVIFQLLNTTQTVVWPALTLTLGNNTLWLSNFETTVVPIAYNVSVRRKSWFSFEFL